MSRWRPGEADIEQLLAHHDLQLVTEPPPTASRL
jgi:hypothetical protein